MKKTIKFYSKAEKAKLLEIKAMDKSARREAILEFCRINGRNKVAVEQKMSTMKIRAKKTAVLSRREIRFPFNDFRIEKNENQWYLVLVLAN